MYTSSFASYGIIKLKFDKVRIFSQHRLFPISNIKIWFQVLTYHKKIPTYHQTSRVINHSILVS